MHHKKISVIIPCYNASKTISRAINSVLQQFYPIFEIICIDDNSKDNTVEILEKEFDNIILIKNKKNVGAAKSRNIGMNKAKGDFIAFLDSDDIWYSNKIEIQIQYIIKFNLVFIGSTFSINEIKQLNNSEYSYKLLFLYKLALSNKLSTSSVIIKNINIKFDERMRYAEDYDLWLRITKFYPNDAGFIIQPLVSLGKHNYSISGLSSHLLKMERGELLALKNNLGYYKHIFQFFSLIKFLRRLIIVYILKNKCIKNN
ncbi:hypothetical protein CBG25_13655 [Arsenophonus sp. ENCA]|uniref:glycosyltransferase family 2 protein n=1 Tax=Arsenophonus sp. ENCA TaxID=1987579 RepID=UPI000BCDB26A|nr:glycosyltransferase family 2 protein [Arsenophonus sp. ENCA]PAV01974.1 hypothetical protein CBG25_13655 [Arsenophonus sp. ENCA]